MKSLVSERIDAAEAARRLGVKPATLYAYVSRGVLTRHRDADGRRSRFDAAEIEQLARKGRPRRRPGEAEVVIESAVTRLGEDRPYYRGRDALELARTARYEQVAEWLWAGEWDERPVWTADPGRVRAGTLAQSALPERVLPLDRLQVIVATLGATDPMRFQLDGPAVAATGRALIAGMVEALPLLGPAPADDGAPSLAGRLWPRLCADPADPALLKALDAALVLLADHELAASTLAARVAASVRADPYAVVTAGLGALGGPLHGGASFGAERMLAAMHGAGDAAAVIGERLRRGERIAGLGHSVYRHGDARGRMLLDLLHDAVPTHPVLAASDAVVAEARARRLPEPNIDLALATLTRAAGMVEGAGEVVFAIARTAGWLAHAIEEYERRSPLRLRARYTGEA